MWPVALPTLYYLFACCLLQPLPCCPAAIEREASKQHGFLASVEKLVADPSKARTAGQGSGISK
jgi:hypothetical protein